MSNDAIKFDEEKPPMYLLPTRPIIEVVRALAHGGQKYGAYNWRKGMAWSRLISAALRHIFAWLGGEDFDSESGLHHLAHAVCCLLFLIEYSFTRPDLDDRYKDVA